METNLYSFAKWFQKVPKVLDLFDLKKPILLMKGSTVVKCLLLVCGVAGSIPDKVKYFCLDEKLDSVTIGYWDSIKGFS